jgi:hypothetical protein
MWLIKRQLPRTSSNFISCIRPDFFGSSLRELRWKGKHVHKQHQWSFIRPQFADNVGWKTCGFNRNSTVSLTIEKLSIIVWFKLGATNQFLNYPVIIRPNQQSPTLVSPTVWKCFSVSVNVTPAAIGATLNWMLGVSSALNSGKFSTCQHHWKCVFDVFEFPKLK